MDWFHNKTIVVPFDFSEASVSAIDVAAKLAFEKGDIHVVHVLPTLTVAEPGMIWEAVNDDDRKKHARDEMIKRLTDFDTDSIHLHVDIGDPGHMIVEHADQADAGLIVIPSHGRTGLSRVIMGSVAERVIRYAHCPVLVLKSEK